MCIKLAMTEQQGELVIRERPLFVVPPNSKLLLYGIEVMFNYWNHSKIFSIGLHSRTIKETWAQRAKGLPEFILCEFPEPSRPTGAS